jgi:hypothetical protein
MVGGSLGVAITGAIFQGAVGTANFAEAGPQDFVDALSKAMAVSGAVALAGAVFAALTIRARRVPISVEAAEAEVNPGGEIIAAREAVAAGK